MKTRARMSRKGKIFLLALALTLLVGPAALAAPGIGDPFDGDQDAEKILETSTYRNQSVMGPGQDLGDGTFEVSVSCDPGDLLFSGWPANIDATSTLLRSSAENPSTWTVRVNKNGWKDDFSTEVLCADNQGSANGHD